MALSQNEWVSYPPPLHPLLPPPTSGGGIMSVLKLNYQFTVLLFRSDLAQSDMQFWI